MSEPTYRVELTHHPEVDRAAAWKAAVYMEAEWDADAVNYAVVSEYGESREAAFEKAQGWCIAKAREPESPAIVFLSEDGDILDPHEAGVLRDANA